MDEKKMLELWDKAGGDIYVYADLVADHEREAFTAHAITSAEKAIDVAIKLERESCAKICDEFFKGNRNTNYSNTIAICIRGRG